MNIDYPKIIAYYLPQFHPIPENDLWWGKGFTEWTNVGKAKPLYRGHYQPRVPADLGYYDLRLANVREEQIKLAKEAGVYGFCYWHYWFGDGKRLLELPFDEVLESGRPEFPFCLSWANESWEAKIWNSDNIANSRQILIKQEYKGVNDYRKHFDYVKKAFRDGRYIMYEGCPIFVIYKPFNFDDISTFINLWNEWVRNEGISSKIYFIANIQCDSDYDRALKLGFDAVTVSPTYRMQLPYTSKSLFSRFILKKMRTLFDKPLIIKYASAMKCLWKDDFDYKEDVIPFILPNWDHSPRSGTRSCILHDSTPRLFYEHALEVINNIQKKNNKLLFLKSWNEWGEGNYMEPDMKFGKQYIEMLGRILKK